MDFALSDEQREWQLRCRRFAKQVIRPAAALHDREETTPWEVLRAAHREGMTGIEHLQLMANDPDGLMSAIYAEEMHWGCAGIALAIAGSGLAASAIAVTGTPDQIGLWLPECYGTVERPKLGAYAVTEPQAGSDVKALRTTARRSGDDWVLNGVKTFITNGGIADVHVVVASVDPTLGHRGQASFVVPVGTVGLRQGKKETKLGIRASHTAELVLEDCRVPDECLLGGDERLEHRLAQARNGSATRGASALATFELTRPFVGASALGIAQAAYEWTLDWLEHEAAGLLDEQHIQHTLADVATEIDAARLLVWRAAWMARNGVPLAGGQGSMSKLKAADVSMWAVTRLIDLVGPAAQFAPCPLEKWFRDAKIFQIFEGTAQIQRTVIARLQRSEWRERSGSDDSITDSPTRASSPTPFTALAGSPNAPQ